MADVRAGKTATDVKTKKRGRAYRRGRAGHRQRTVGLLGGIFSFAVEQGYRADNPVRGVKRTPDRKNKRYLSAEELARLGVELSKAESEGENPHAVNVIRLLIFTGCRKSEILSLEWSHVDSDMGYLRLPTSKTGEKDVPVGGARLPWNYWPLCHATRVRNTSFPPRRVKANMSGFPRFGIAYARVRA